MKNDTSSNSRSTQISKIILKGLYHALGGDKHIAFGYDYFDKYVPERRVSAQVYWATVRRMKKQGWVEEAEKLGKKFLKLTKKGKVHALMSLMQESGKTVPRSWDGKWRIAMFDIPEREGDHERYKIRNCLKQCGFHCLQKSVYIHPHEIPAHVVTYLRESELHQFIRFLRVDKIDDSRELERRFGLMGRISRRTGKQ